VALAAAVAVTGGLWWVSSTAPAPPTAADVDRAVQRGIEQAQEAERNVPPEATTAAYAAPPSGWQRLYIDHVLQADRGADLDFLVGRRGHEVTRESH